MTLVGMDITFATCCGRLCGFVIDYRIHTVSIHICMNACHLCGGPLCMLGSSNLCYLLSFATPCICLLRLLEVRGLWHVCYGIIKM